MTPPQRAGAPGAPAQPRSAAWPGRLTLWPLDLNSYGLDVRFGGHWACEDADRHVTRLRRWGLPAAVRREADGDWTVRLGPLRSLDVARVLFSLGDWPTSGS